MRRLLWIPVFLLGCAPASAQTVTSYTLKLFNQGAPSPFQTTTLPASGFQCAQTPKITSTNTVNPTRIVFDDPANPTTADCIYTDPGTGPLLSLPFGTQAYTATLAAVNTTGTSADSTQSAPFTRPGVVASVPTGVRVVR